MATRGGKSQPTLRLENEVERGRELGDWKKILEILDNGRSKILASNSENLMNFLHAEAKLELWMEEHQPTEVHISQAKSALLDVKKAILLCLNQSNDQPSLRTDGYVLLAKVYYASGLYEEALEELQKSGFDNLDTVTCTVRNLQLIAEAYGIRGYCLEKVGRSWRNAQTMTEAQRRDTVLASYRRAADYAIAYFQALDRYIATLQPANTAGQLPAPVVDKKRPYGLLDHAIRRGPNILLENDSVDQAVEELHWLLSTCETSTLSPIRLLLYRRLAEVALRHKWVPVVNNKLAMRKAKCHSGAGIFTPRNLWEDIFLTLQLSETTVMRDGVLNQAPEFAKARRLANINAASIIDLLTLAAGRWGTFSLPNECLERALKFSFEEPHIWSQYSLTFHAEDVRTRKGNHATLEAAKLVKKPTPLLLLAAQQLFSRWQVKEALSVIEMAKEKELLVSQKLLPRVYLYQGIGTFLLSFEKHMHQQRTECLELAAKLLEKAIEADPTDYLTLHWLGRVYAWCGNIQASFSFSVRALRAYPFHIPTLMLIILLLSSQRNYTDALSVTEEALDEYPDHLGFLQMKAAIEEVLLGPEVAISTLKQMLVLWKNIFDDSVGSRSESPEYKPTGGGTLHLPSPVDKENSSVVSFRASSMAGSSTNTGTLNAGFRADSALSEIASSLSLHGSLGASSSGELAWAAQINIWVMLAETYLKLEKPEQALAAIDEASQVAPAHPDILYMRGKIAEYCEEYGDARMFYESAVAVHPTHSKALQNLALIQHYFGSHRLAEKTLQDSIRLEPYDHQTWYKLGKVLEALGECAEAGDCMATALDIEATAPVLPFTIIPICFE